RGVLLKHQLGGSRKEIKDEHRPDCASVKKKSFVLGAWIFKRRGPQSTKHQVQSTDLFLRQCRFLKRAFHGQRLQEVQQILTLLWQDLMWFKIFLVQVLVWFSTCQHDVDRFLQRLCASVVKIRRGVGDVSERWSL